MLSDNPDSNIAQYLADQYSTGCDFHIKEVVYDTSKLVEKLSRSSPEK